MWGSDANLDNFREEGVEFKVLTKPYVCWSLEPGQILNMCRPITTLTRNCQRYASKSLAG